MKNLENKINNLLQEEKIKQADLKPLKMLYHSYIMFGKQIDQNRHTTKEYCEIYMNNNDVCHNRFDRYWCLLDLKSL